MQNFELIGLSQANAVLNSSNSEVMAQLSQMTVIMNIMQVHLKNIFIDKNEPNKDQEEVLLLEMGDQFYSWY